MERIERTIVLPASPERVWSALTGPGEISAWFGAEVEFEPRPGARATFRWADGRKRGAVVESLEPSSRLCFRWMPFELGPDEEVRPVPPGRVEFLLRETGGNTELTVTEWVHLLGTGGSAGSGSLLPSPTRAAARPTRLGIGAAS